MGPFSERVVLHGGNSFSVMGGVGIINPKLEYPIQINGDNLREDALFILRGYTNEAFDGEMGDWIQNDSRNWEIGIICVGSMGD